MNKKKIIVASVVLVAGILVFFGKEIIFLFNKQSLLTPAVSSPSELKIYTNSTYQYEIRYPSAGSVGRVLEEDRASDTESAFVAVSWSGNNQGSIEILVVPKTQGLQSLERQQVLSLAPEKFAEYGRNAELAYLAKNKSNYNTNLRLSDIQEAVIGGQQAYGFSINGFSEAWPLGGFEGPSGRGVNNYYAFQNNEGDKFIIAYPANNPVAQKIVDSFAFTNGSTTVSTQN